MPRGVGLVIFGVLAAALAPASAHAGGTTTTTTTGTTTTTAAPTYARLVPSYLPTACLGAGSAVIEEPGRPPLALGTPASSLGPSAYPATTAPLVAFESSTSSGSTCKTAQVTLQSVSLMRGTVTATSVQATAGRGSVTGLEIDGSPTSLAPGEMVAIGVWAQLHLGKRVGRVAAPLVLVLLAPRDGLPPGTTIAVAFAAAPQPAAKPRTEHRSRANTQHAGKTDNSGSQNQAKGASKTTKKLRRRLPKPPPNFPASTFPFLLAGGLAPAAQDNRVVSTAMQYLGVPYRWGGASPKAGFDCSGLVKYVFAKLGVSLPHYAAAQWHSPDGVWVAPNRLQPGDLVFFTGSDGTRKAPGHVGIYVGDGYLIDAPHTGSLVRIDSLNERLFANQYVGARRIVGTSTGGSSPQSTGTPALAAMLGVTKAATPVNAVAHLFPPQIGLSPLAEMPVIATAGTAALRHASRNDALWAGAPLGGLFLLLGAGVLVFRRRGLL
jgi:cell wall-associated NlpC family hydrolase